MQGPSVILCNSPNSGKTKTTTPFLFPSIDLCAKLGYIPGKASVDLGNNQKECGEPIAFEVYQKCTTASTQQVLSYLHFVLALSAKFLGPSLACPSKAKGLDLTQQTRGRAPWQPWIRELIKLLQPYCYS